jgi:alkylation response protein AidB-like acyl-CoA dehydrogenase
LVDDPVVQTTYGTGYAIWQMAKSMVESLARTAWDCVLANRALSSHNLAEISGGCALAVAKLRMAIGELMALVGMAAIQPDADLARAWRDLQTLAAHGSISPRNLGSTGAALLGG